MTWAVKQKVGNATGKAVLMMLANYADAEGRCFPSQETLASDCECNVRSVARWLVILERMNLIGREHRRRDDGYRTSDSILLNTSHATVSPDTKSHDNKSPDSQSILTGHKVRAINRTSQVNRKDISSAREELAKVLDDDHAAAVVEHRQKLRKPLTAHAAFLLAKTLAKHLDPNAAADTMIERGWQTIKPDWVARAGPDRPPKPPTLAERFRQLGQFANEQDRRNLEPPQQALQFIPPGAAD